MKVTGPVVVAIGVHCTANVAGSPCLGMLWVASSHPLVPTMVLVSAPTGANVPCWLERRLNPAAPGSPLGVVTVMVSVMVSAGCGLSLLAASVTIGATPPL